MFPLRIFGFIDSSRYRKEFVRFVLEMDKAAEFQKNSFRSSNDSHLFGSLSLTREEKLSIQEYPQFSQALYYKQVMMIITELLNTSRVTITNTATYLSILNTALNLQKDVMEEFGNVPNAKSKSKELNELTSQLLELQQSIQVRLLRGVFHESNLQSKTCDVIFRGL